MRRCIKGQRDVNGNVDRVETLRVSSSTLIALVQDTLSFIQMVYLNS